MKHQLLSSRCGPIKCGEDPGKAPPGITAFLTKQISTRLQLVRTVYYFLHVKKVVLERFTNFSAARLSGAPTVDFDGLWTKWISVSRNAKDVLAKSRVFSFGRSPRTRTKWQASVTRGSFLRTISCSGIGERFQQRNTLEDPGYKISYMKPTNRSFREERLWQWGEIWRWQTKLSLSTDDKICKKKKKVRLLRIPRPPRWGPLGVLAMTFITTKAYTKIESILS